MNDKSPAEDLEKLLPWYVNGTLNETETDRVTTWLATTGTRERLSDTEIALSQRLVEAPPELAEILEQRTRAYEDLVGQLTVTPSRANEHDRNQGQARRSWFVAALSMGVVAAVASIGWWSAPPLQPSEYSTMSDVAAPNVAVIVQVVVRDSVTREQMQELAHRLHAAIVSGPTTHNVYRLVLPTQSEPAADLQWLRDQSEVAFAEIQVP
jgi:hypothetical protein